MTGIRPGVRLGIDVGSVRVGVASCDPSGTLVSPVETVRRDSGRGGAPPSDVARIVELAREREAIEVVVGLPLSLSGRRGPAAEAASGYARGLARARAHPGAAGR